MLNKWTKEDELVFTNMHARRAQYLTTKATIELLTRSLQEGKVCDIKHDVTFDGGRPLKHTVEVTFYE